MSVVVRCLENVGIVHIQLRRARGAATFSHRVSLVCGVEPPRLVAVGPECWLAIGASNLFAVLSEEGIAASASLTDQSSGYLILRLTGPRVRETFAKLMPIDFHPRAFAVGAVAATVAAHIGVIVWRCADDPDGCPTFELACPRSFSTDLVAALRRA